jgi:guanine deaminase
MILRAAIFHTPRNPFRYDDALEVFPDGALAIDNGRVAACGHFVSVRAQYPDEPVRDLRGGVLLPGFIDAHIHYPQVRALGGIGYSLLDWLEQITLPEEVKFRHPSYARTVAQEFLHLLASHGTTTALVFGAHFAGATAELFEQAQASGLRIISGLVLADRHLLPELHQSPEEAYRESAGLIRRFHGAGRLLYAVTPRFALSASEAILEVCASLLAENPGVRFQTHMNESVEEIESVASLFPDASDYLAVYERFGLAQRRSVFAHNIHPANGELERLAACGSAVAFCPASNAALGSGFFPLQRHVQAGVRFALGTDVGGGTGFGMLKEGLQAYLTQRLAPNPVTLDAAHLLYLATRAGAEALGLEDQIGDFTAEKSADFVYLRPPDTSPLAAVMRNAPSPQRLLGAIFTLAGAECVQETCIEGNPVFQAVDRHPE